MKITSVTPQNGEYVQIQNDEGDLIRWIRFSATCWEVDRDDQFVFERVYDCEDEEKLYQEFISHSNIGDI